MKRSSSSNTARVLLGIPFLLVGFLLAAAALSDLSAKSRAAVKAVIPQVAVPSQFSGTFDPNVYPCSSPLQGPFVVPPGQARIVVQVDATIPANDITVTLLYGAGPNPTFVTSTDTGVGEEVINYSPGGAVPAGTYQVQVCVSPNPAAPFQQPYTYTGLFTYDDTGGGGNPPNTGPLPAPPQDPGAKIGYENFEPPGVLTPVLITSSGGKTVEYLGRYAIEPSIGANWSTGTIAYQSDLETLFVSFDDSCNLANPKATWVNRPSNLSILVDSDPILFTDHQTNRTFVSELTLLGTDTSKVAFTDSDGMPTASAPLGWTPDQQAQGLASAVDHQTMGGGPYNLNAIPPPVPSPTYP